MGVELEFLSSGVLNKKIGEEKIKFMLDKIKEGKILITDAPLTPIEESKLIEMTMGSIDDKFKGIEVATLSTEEEGIFDKIVAFFGIKKGLTVIGPSKMIKKIKKEKEPQKILLTAETEEEKQKDKEKA